MKVTNSELIYEAEQNYVRATIYADSAPSPLPKPEDMTLCCRIYLCWNPETGTAGYYTVEYDNLLGETWFLCGWTANGTHMNYSIVSAVTDPEDPEYEAALEKELKAVLELMASKK